MLDCHLVAGDFDYFLKIRVRDIADFNRTRATDRRRDGYIRHVRAEIAPAKVDRGALVIDGVTERRPCD